jgi:AAA domain/DnaB-like helicase N terminal domain
MPDNRADRVIPQAISAEGALLGACIASADARLVLVHELTPGDFYSPGNGHIADAIITLTKAGSAIDTLIVSSLLADRGLLDAAGGPGVLLEYVAHFPKTTGARAYARLIAEAATRRRLIALGAELTEAVFDRTKPIEDAIHATMSRLRELDLPAEPEGPDHIQTLLDLSDEYNWIIPNLLEKGDRLMVTSTEGAGKSTLLAQMAVQFAAGIHPFACEFFDPVTVLLVDVENGPGLVRRRFAGLLSHLPVNVQPALASEPGFDAGRVRVRVKPEGIDLLSRNDRRWFTERVMVNEPAVVFTGPIYKLHRGNPIDEEPAREISGYFDDLRETYGITLVIEAHSPYGRDGGEHRILRPFGASLWSRWPEFGFGMRKAEPREDNRQAVDWLAWRGARDEGRQWPRQLVRGRSHEWPWENPALLSHPMTRPQSQQSRRYGREDEDF